MAEIQSTPDLPWTVRLFVSAASFAVDASRRSNFTVNRCLFNLFDYKLSPLTKPHKNIKSSDVVVAADPSRNLWFRLYTPTAATTKLPIIVYFHGGGFVFMSAASKPYDDFCQRLARELPAVVVSVNYRLAPEHRYPCQYDDGFDVLKFIDDSQSSLFEGANLGQCFLAGDSAGGNIAHQVAIRASGHEFRELQVVGMLAIQPFFGGEERTESETRLKSVPLVNIERTDWMWKAFLPEGSDRDHPVVNVFGPNAVDISGVDFPATIVVVGGFDPLQDWQKRYYEGLKKRGKQAELVVFPNAIHTFYAYPELDDSSVFINKVRDFVQLQSVNVAETRQ
ncbi:probable carboxylesterase 18 [Rosa chinensis]|uniref:probable carboxylesterase 18 n=1 Tax=Rosa chinensis TaxID=74649 RepID=UPI000D08B3D1|nr:probable carboxylesterase 18 [Rosa chinensis]